MIGLVMTTTARTARARRRTGLLLVVLLPALVMAAVVGCGTSTSRLPAAPVPGGYPARGAELISSYGCGSCHTIGGIRGADGLVGPPLTGFEQRSYIAGELPNSPQNLQRWIMDPQQVEPGTAMPDLGVTAADARDIAAYLLQRR